MSNGNKKLTQADRLSEILIRLKPDVTAKDKEDAEGELDLTRSTISKYLNGNVYDNDTAVRLLNYFRDKIAKREKAIVQ